MNNNSFKIPDFRALHNKLQLNMSTVAIHLKNKTQHCFHSIHPYLSIQINHFYNRHHLFSIQVNFFLRSSPLYYKTYVINNINLQMEINMYTRISANLTTISQPLVWSLLFGNTRKNSNNLTNCIRMKTNLMGLEIILYSNWISSMISTNLLAYLQMHILKLLLSY